MVIGQDMQESVARTVENTGKSSCHTHPDSETRHRTTLGLKMNGYKLSPSVGTLFWILIGSCLLLGTLVVQAEQDKDFEFEGEDVIIEDAKIVDGTFLDDEDYLHDDGSTPDDDEDHTTGSGTEPPEISTIFPTRGPTESLDGPGTIETVFYRITLNFTNVRYETSLGDRNSGEFQHAAMRYKRAIEGLFKDIPGQQTANILQFRPGSADLDAYPPSMLVTADLGTVEYYYQLTIFNTLNGALNRGYVGSYEVSPHGFSFRPISGHGSSCPRSIGRDPTSLPRLGDTQANLMLNNRFICDGFVQDFTYFRGTPDGTAYVGIWRQYGDMEFILRHRIELPPAVVGIHTVTMDPPIPVERGDFLGIHYSSTARIGIIANSIPEDHVLDKSELFQTLCVNVRDEDLALNTPLDFSGIQHDLQRKTFALIGVLNYKDGTTPDLNIPTPSPRLTCSPYQFRCRDGTCIQANQRCDAQFHCPDRSDEFECGCNIGEFHCDSGECVSLSKKCNREYDCRDSSDEFNCGVEPCSVDEFDCGDGTCLEESQHCNGVRECRNGQDEVNCPTRPPKPSPTPSSACQYNEFHCGDGQCIDVRRRCDGSSDCRNGADEQHCDQHECLYYQFRCNNYRCIDSRRRCNSQDDCGDGSDERGCGACVEGTEYECVDGTCIDIRRQCDGYVDCADGSDERECPEPTCPPGDYQCPASGRCIAASRECDGYADCEDGADEHCGTPSCSVTEFQCKTTGKCIDGLRVCDGSIDCEDSSDEADCLTHPECQPGEFQCLSGECIEQRRVCNGYIECIDGSDEHNCVFTCAPNEFACGDGSCIPSTQVCDGNRQCLDESDEADCGTTTTCIPVYEFACHNDGSCIDARRVCDGYQDCRDGSDEIRCAEPVECTTVEFQCGDKSCIDIRKKCDGYQDCTDGTDERDCVSEKCDLLEFSCDSVCIDLRRRCDGYEDCRDGSDEQDCDSKCSVLEFECGDGTCIDIRRTCDGHRDCADGTDEVGCTPDGNLDCSEFEFQCGDGSCIDVRRKCDGLSDCRDGTDEQGCGVACADNQFSCGDACIDLARRCDGQSDCNDGSDEINCEEPKICSEIEFRCGDGSCIDARRTCDGYQDCTDGSDEQSCGVACADNQFSCGDACIDLARRCDGQSDCHDGSDEINCEEPKLCSEFEFRCGDGSCIDARRTCDGYQDCTDGSDEKSCGVACADNQFSCGNACIDLARRCDGQSDCHDGSDEINCEEPNICSEFEFRCGDGSCIDARRTCDGYQDCTDGSDEKSCGVECADNQFSCGDACIDLARRCDGQSDCHDGSDEINCEEPNICSEFEFRCGDGSCIDARRTCDGYQDCTDGSDEKSCGVDCADNQFSCGDACIDLARRCDGLSDCNDGSDEINCEEPKICSEFEFRCGDGSCIDARRTCDGYQDCTDGSDEKSCGVECADNQFSCGDACVDLAKRCDGQSDCNDGSDELNCGEPKICSEFEFQCGDSSCIDARRTCDGNQDCTDGSDERNCGVECAEEQFSCGDACIELARRCDGQSDCNDGSDEINCKQPKICSEFEFQCGDSSCIDARRTCDGNQDCTDGSDERNCGVECAEEQFSCGDACIELARRCDGQSDCNDGSDEINCKQPKICSEFEFQCGDSSCIDARRTCDGNQDCTDGSDERNCGVECAEEQFSCGDACIEFARRCDGQSDCNDGSDEINCKQPKICSEFEFQCGDSSCIDARRTCDGNQDCTDGSDERNCGVECAEEQFSCGDACIELARRCDGQSDCNDGSDEINCRQPKICSEFEFQCGDSSCIDARRTCDGNQDCTDGSDERSCGVECAEEQFSCGDACIELARRCDGQSDCNDGSDEINCEEPKICSEFEFRCGDGSCINVARACDGFQDCSDGIDEIGCDHRECDLLEFTCGDGSCIDIRRRCDEYEDCHDGSDEQGCEDLLCAPLEFECGDGTCIDIRRKCDGHRDCPDGTDETDCGAQACSALEFTCGDGSCVDVRRKCDGNRDCTDNSDETDCGGSSCNEGEFVCGDGSCIDARQQCNGYQDCRDGSDERGCETTCSSTQFACSDGTCIDIRRKCDGRPDCPDRDDESQCEQPGCSSSEFACGDGTCIDDRRTCDGYSDCRDGSDESNCVEKPECSSHEFSCLDGTCIDVRRACNGQPDCPDASDEFNCDKPPCSYSEFACRDLTCIDIRLTCDGRQDCPDGFDETGCVIFTCAPHEFACGDGSCVNTTYKCDGFDDCFDASDELDCEPSTCSPSEFRCGNGLCVDASYQCDGVEHCVDGSDEADCATPGVTCSPFEYLCKNGHCIDIRRRCNGFDECGDNSDEEMCAQTTCLWWQFACNNGRCIDLRRKCNGHDECGDSSDERGCGGDEPCLASEFTCEDGTCIDARQECDGRDDCQDGSDEFDCQPACDPAREFTCTSGECISLSQRCDKQYDCRDYSDEQNCPPPTCDENQFTCADGSCIDNVFKCDGQPHCDDASDEVDCPAPTCTSLEITCNDGTCIDIRKLCDGHLDCPDGLDEDSCGPPDCGDNEFKCNNGVCVSNAQRCDGLYDCEDGSDEFNCGPITCSTTQWLCKSGECIDEAMRCDREYNCRDGSDEFDCAVRCRSTQFQCGSGECIESILRCNQRYDCRDRSDEENCAAPTCQSHEFQCKNGDCIDARRRCDRRYDCQDGSDESDCAPPTQAPCTYYQFQCDDGSCIDKNRHCDSRFDCRDGSDEIGCAASTCSPYQFQCDNGECIEKRLRCNRQYDCSDGTDEFHCEPDTCSPREFQCQSGECIDSNLRCDREYNCHDGSDEEDCGCGAGQFSCGSSECIDEFRHCDGSVDCRDGSDEQSCPDLEECGEEEYACGDGMCIPITFHCDGEEHCIDGSDETDCGSVTVTVSPERLRIREGMTATFICRVLEGGSYRLQWMRGNQPLPFKARDDNGRLTIPDGLVEDSDRYTCSVVGQEQYRAHATLTVENIIGPVSTPEPPPVGDCNIDEMQCRNGQCVPRDYACDGDNDCADRSDELNCIPMMPCEPNEFQCTSGKCVQKIWRCDGDDDCGDESDERDCPTSAPGSFCNYDEFRCASVDQCIPSSYHCDGEIDCQDNSDEIGCVGPVVLRPPPGEHYAQQGETVTIECQARGVPTPLIVWRLNWGHIGGPPSRVFYTNDNGHGVLTIRQVQKDDEGAYTCEALNSKGSIFAQPDTILIVNPPVGICSPPFFNSEAERTDQCLRCFCFDMTDECISSSLHIGSISVGNSLPLVNRDTRDDLGEQFVSYNPVSRKFAVNDYSNRVTGGQFYFSLPNMFLNNKLTSYGGSLKYTLRYETSLDSPSFVGSPDVILAANGLMLYHTHFSDPFSAVDQTVEVLLKESDWSRDEYGRQRVTREDFLLALQNIDYILIKSNYDNNQRTVWMSQLSMAIAGPRDQRRGRALLVEQCSCPTGYTGTSCETCGAGYYRVESGSYLGSCVACNCNGHSNDCDPETGYCENCLHNTEGRSCDRCLSGFYGDATRGTPTDCLACTCPLASPGNSFSKTCYLETDREVTCDACPPEYAGRRCERCSPGYEGNPMVPGDYCKPADQRCDHRGSLTLSPDPTTGQCECKPYATGPSCASCVENSFHLAEDYPHGCVPCVCMGVTQMCSSTTWNRAQVSLAFVSDSQGVVITDAARNDEYTSNLRVDRHSRELTNSGFQNLPQDTYYWALPPKFLNNKVTSYGGFLRFTVSHTDGHTSSLFSPDIFPDVEIRGNNIILEYYHSVLSDFHAGPSSFQVPLFEHFWVRPDGNEATREHLLMALADLDYILIKATYTGSTTDAGISDISLDIAEDRNTGLGRAYEVEQCQCPVGYSGLSCENCDHGYRRTGGGLFLGNCGRCDCNGHSEDCDTGTGLCRACLHNTEGDRCERCAPGYYGDPTRGSPNDCQPCPCPLTYAPNQFSPTCVLEADNQVSCTACPPGHTGRRCEQCLPGYQGNPMVPGDYCKSGSGQCNCDPKGMIPNTQCDPNSRQCQCKTYVSGNNCDSCKPGYFYMDTNNAQGCLSCYCNGVTDQCSSSNYYLSQIIPMYDAGSHNFMLTSRRLTEQITDGFRVSPRLREITFNKFEDLQRDRQSLYFSLPPRFRGNQVASYGGNLKFTLEYAAALDSGNTFRDVDLELISNGNRFYHTFRQSPTPYEHNQFSIPLREDTFVSLGGSEPTRESFLDALSNIDAILIRATHHSIMSSATLRDLTMDTAVPEDTGLGRAMIVEQCTCPPGYTGLSCQECSNGYSHVPDPNNPRGSCIGCNCNGHTQTCDPSNGGCVSCQHNTVGDRCQDCAPGYYGDATVGTRNDCRPCPCPLTLPSNQFSSSCYLDADGQPTCSACPPEYTGRNCERCAQGYIGDPREPGNVCRTDTGSNSPHVEVSPKTIAEAVNANITFYCSVRGQGSFNVQWIRGDGKQLSSRTRIGRDNSLTIHSAQSTDAGSYICVATSSFGRGQDETKLVIVGERLMRVIVQEPRQQTVQEGAIVRFTCQGYSKVRNIDTGRLNYTYTLAWTKEGGLLPYWAEDDGQGILTIRNVHAEDAGTYSCIGSNAYSIDTDEAVLTVATSDEPPKVEIVPRVINVNVGDAIEMTCLASGRPQPRIEWSRRGGSLSRLAQIDGGTLRISSASASDDGEYVCAGTNPAGRSEVHIVVYVIGGPPEFEVIVGQPETIVVPGQDARLPCSARETVVVDSINWDREGAPLPPGSYQHNGVLVIPNCRPTYGGRYVCTITLVDGAQNQGYTTLTIDQGGDINQPPTASMQQDRVTITQGTTGTLRCEVSGVPAPTVTWSKVRAELGPNHQVQGNILRILEASPSDRGLYVCRAENAAGVAQTSVSVEVERREPPRLEIYPESTTVISPGSSALFQCRITGGIPPPTIVWARANNERFTSNTDVLDSGVLRFNQVTGAEQGPYVCTASNEAGTVTATASLKIQGAPHVMVTPPGPLTVYPGQRVSFECVAEGDPPATVYWQSPHGYRLESSGVPGSANTALYSISQVTAEDAGTYVCSARNDVGESQGTIQIVVQGGGGGVIPGGYVSVSVIPKSMSVLEGSTAEFACQAVGSPTPTVTWRREGGTLSRDYNINNGILQLYRVSAEDAGTYTCIAATSAGQEQVSATLHVQVAPEVSVSPSLLTIRPGEPLRLHCLSGGSGDVTIEWSKVGGALSTASRVYSGVLEIQPVTTADAGRYKCIAINDFGRSEAYVDVKLLVLPTASVFPSTASKNSGATVQFQCNAGGSPPPRIQWVKQGGSLPDQHQTRDGTLILYNLRPEDSGVYVCIVSNDAGDYRSFSELKVQGSGTAGIVERIQTVSEGATVEISCAVASVDTFPNAGPVIQWDRVGARMPHTVRILDDRLIIDRIRTVDAGVYRCTASNSAGKSIAQVVINVEAPPSISLSRQVRTASLGSRLTLVCDVTGGSPPPNIQWRKKDGELPRDHEVHEGVLTIRQLRTPDLGEYICIARNKFGTSKGYILVDTGELVPYFDQNPVSYVSYPTINDAYLEFDIEMSFKPSATEGLLLYNGVMDGSSGDFVSFGLRDKRAELRFNVGAGPAIIVSDPLTLEEWYTVMIHRDEKQGTLVVNGQEFKGVSPGDFRGLDLAEDMYVGGLPDFTAIARDAGFNTGFVGCISRVVINGLALNLGGEAHDMSGVRDCPVCQVNPCDHQGRCKPALTEVGYQCECPSGYSGKQCEMVGERCYTGACGGGRCYDLDDGSGYRCTCPVGKIGDRCQHGTEIHEPSFTTESFIAYSTPRDVTFDLQAYMMVKPDSLDDSLLLYSSQDPDGSGDYVSLAIKDGYVEFMYNLGSGPATIRSRDRVVPGQWMTILAERNQRDGSLSINNEQAEKGYVEGDTIGLNLRTSLFVGGVDKNVRVAPGIGVTQGFSGCISQLSLKGTAIDLVNDAIDSNNVEDCGVDSPCAKRPCEHNGLCIEVSPTEYSCNCPRDYTGVNCELEMNVCITNNPCGIRGQCVVENERPVCHCFLGYGGHYCADDVELYDNVQLDGTGYVELHKDLLPESSAQTQEVLEMTVVTLESEAMLFWQGQEANKALEGNDYLAILVQNGQVVLSYELGSGPANITTKERIDDGLPHFIVVTRTGNRGTLQIDGGRKYEGTSEGILSMLNAKGSLYLGGLPNMELMTNDRFYWRLVGCIQEVFIRGQGPLDFGTYPIGGINVLPCDKL